MEKTKTLDFKFHWLILHIDRFDYIMFLWFLKSQNTKGKQNFHYSAANHYIYQLQKSGATKMYIRKMQNNRCGDPQPSQDSIICTEQGLQIPYYPEIHLWCSVSFEP